MHYINLAMTNSEETPRATKRPAHLDAPAYLTKSGPVPEPKATEFTGEPGREKPDPVRYGDWENKGIAIDF
jgi:hypothetical protein